MQDGHIRDLVAALETLETLEIELQVDLRDNGQRTIDSTCMITASCSFRVRGQAVSVERLQDIDTIIPD